MASGLWKQVATAAAAAFGVAALGEALTDLGPWYWQLMKPSWQPPDWLFGPAWTLIFALTVAGGVLGWRTAASRPARQRLLILFAANGFLNVAWSLLFFRLQRPDWALVEVVFLWLSILALIVALARHSISASLLLAPYLVWVTFASILNWSIVELNRPF